MEIPSRSVNFYKSRTRVSFSSFNFLQFVLISTLFITKSTSIPHDLVEIPYDQYCNGVVHESQSTETQLSTDNFLKLDKAVYSLGFENPQFNFNPISSQIASFSIRKAYETKSKGVVKVNAVLNLIGPDIIEYFSGDHSRRRLRLVKVRPPRFEPRKNIGAGFMLFGYWDSDSGKLCMVGSGSVSSLRSVNVVLKLDYPNSTVLDTSLINGTLESITPTKFKPVSILGASSMEYNYTYINKEIENNGFSMYDEMENVSLSLPNSRNVYGRGICSIITWGLRFELDYENYDCNNVSCSFITVGDETFPRFMSIKVVDCLEDGKVRYILQFSNSTYGKGMSFYPLTSLVSEGSWNDKKNRLELVACQLFDKKTVQGCSIRLALSLPSTLSLKQRSRIIGKMWSTKTKDLGYVSFQSPANLNMRIKGTYYNYSQHEKIEALCKKSLDSKGKKGIYPDPKSSNLRFDMMVKNKKGQIAYGYASPLYINDTFYSSFTEIEDNKSLIKGKINVSYVMSFTPRGEFSFGGKNPSKKMIEISAEGVYNSQNGNLCLIGCKHVPFKKFEKKQSLDCELLISIKYAPLNGKKAGSVHGTIKSTRKKSDPFYFEPVDFGSSSITTNQARESILKMDLEITMVLISNTFTCIFIGLQLYHAKKNPEILPLISIFMLIVLTLAHMIPLLLNFEAIFIKNRKQNVFLGSDQWLEVNEVLVRVITMVAFLLQFRLLQLSWLSRNANENKKSLWICDKKVIFISIPLYIFAGLIAYFSHSLQASHKKISYFGPQGFHTHDLATKNGTFWGELKSYIGLFLDLFLLPQILFNLFCDSPEKIKILAPSFYIGSSIVRLLPHGYDLYRTHSNSWFYDKIYANPKNDYYSTIWDFVICFGGMICVLVVYLQQRFGGRFVVPKRFRESVLYEKVPVVTTQEQ